VQVVGSAADANDDEGSESEQGSEGKGTTKN
jgi:hypothetical protein